MKLLEKAKSALPSKKTHGWCPTDEQIELAVAWLNGEVRSCQVACALDLPSNANMWTKMTSIIRAAVKHKKIKVVIE